MLIEVRKICGCCHEKIEVDDDFYFPTNEVSATIIDKYGKYHFGIDTFYLYKIIEN